MVGIGHVGNSIASTGRRRPDDRPVGAVTRFSGPAVSPAYMGVGYIIGPQLAALNFAGGVLAWGLMVPLLIYFLGPQLTANVPPGTADRLGCDLPRSGLALHRAADRGRRHAGGRRYTLFRMRKNLAIGMRRAVSDLKKAGRPGEATNRTERDLNAKVIFGGIGVVLLCMILLYTYFSGTLPGGVVAAVVMLILGFFFAAVSGNLVGMIGSSNNPVSGLTLSTLIIAALLMVAIGVSGMSGVAAVLGVAAVVCVSSAVAGEMLQDLKVGHILGGTPRSMQIGDFLGVLVASAALYFPLLVLHQGNIKTGGIGFGDPQLSAPQAGLMASLAQGIVGGDMPWPLVVVGIFMGFALIMVQVKSPMLFAVGMYLPLETTSAIFIGGVMRWLTDSCATAASFNDAQKARVENAGVLTASGLIAGEALMGLVKAGFSFANKRLPEIFAQPSIYISATVLLILGALMIYIPLTNAGRPEDPAPPTAIM